MRVELKISSQMVVDALVLLRDGWSLIYRVSITDHGERGRDRRDKRVSKLNHFDTVLLDSVLLGPFDRARLILALRCCLLFFLSTVHRVLWLSSFLSTPSRVIGVFNSHSAM